MNEVLLANIGVLGSALIFGYLATNMIKEHWVMKTMFLILSLGLLIVGVNINIYTANLFSNSMAFDSLLLVYRILNIVTYTLIAYYVITLLIFMFTNMLKPSLSENEKALSRQNT